MRDASEVKRYFIETITGNTCAVYEEKVDGLDSYTEMVTASDHDRIVAELRANLSTCQSILQGAFNVQTDLKVEIDELRAELTEAKAEVERQREAYESALENHVDMQLTIATQARVIEKLKEELIDVYEGHRFDVDEMLERIQKFEQQGEGTP